MPSNQPRPLPFLVIVLGLLALPLGGASGQAASDGLHTIDNPAGGQSFTEH